MAFSFFELSRFFARKVALYDFNREGVHLRFSSTDHEIEHAGNTYVPARGISHTAIRESMGSDRKNQVTLTVPYLLDGGAVDYPVTQELGNWWRPFPPSQRVLVTIMAMHVGDPDEEVVVEWQGRVVGPSYTRTQLKLTCDPSFRSGAMSGSIPRIQRGCGVALYSQGLGMCNLTPSPFSATLTAVSGVTLAAAEFGTSEKSLAGGLIEWIRPDGLVETRTVMSHAGEEIRVQYGALDLEEGLIVSTFFGCAHNLQACESHGNEINYPGFVNLPGENPMGRSQSW